MIVLNTLSLDKDYSELTDPIEYMKPVNEYGLDDDFYGGNVDMVAKLKNSPVYLLLDTQTDGLIPKDTAVDSLEDLEYQVLRNICKEKKIEFSPVGTKKEELIGKLLSRCLLI